MNKHGYTLLELVTALAVFALLLAIGIPIYMDQLNKSQVAAALSTLTNMEQAAKAAYEENPSNTTLSYGGVTFANNVVTALPIPPVVNGLYIRPGGNANVTASQFLVCVYVDKLSFSGYVAPTAGQTGTNSRMCKQVTTGTSNYTNKCGSLQNGSLDIPNKYLPRGCTCANIWAGTC